MFKDYYRLAKPGIVYGNLVTTIAAFLYASQWQLTSAAIWEEFLATIVGLGLVIASACVFNNYIDMDIDAKMARTKDRPLVSGAISETAALFYGLVLGILGFGLLMAFVNAAATTVALAGFVVYVFAYTYAKRVTSLATEIGSISGAVPILVGYVAVTGGLNGAAWILFFVLVFWQMPHFYAIAMFRSEEYAAAGIPVLPLKRGTRATTTLALLYISLFALAVFALTYFGYAGNLYLIVVELAALAWFWYATHGFSAADAHLWARRLFFVSLCVLLVFSVMLSLAAVLP